MPFTTYPTGSGTGRGSVVRLCSEMDFNHNRLLGPSNPFLRLPTLVCKSSTSTSQVSQPTHSRPKGLCSVEDFRERERSPARKEGYSPSSSQYWSRFHIDLLSGSQETQPVVTDHQPMAPQCLHSTQAFPDGNTKNCPTISPPGLVGNFFRLKGCLPPCTHPYTSPEKNPVHLLTQNLPVPMPPIWPLNCSKGLDKNH